MYKRQPWIIAALDIARAKGLRLPIVCNTGGYETVESVEEMCIRDRFSAIL